MIIKNRKIKIFFFIFASFIGLISVLKGFYDSTFISFDFHYSPTKLVAEGINHYQYILDGKHDHSIDDKLQYAQNGNYAHGLFVLLIPPKGTIFLLVNFLKLINLYKPRLLLYLFVLNNGEIKIHSTFCFCFIFISLIL